jgi:4-hydroxymandelate synthase
LEQAMTSSDKTIFQDMLVDHVEFYVGDLAAETRWLVDSFGFGVYARTDDATAEVGSVGVGANQIRFVLTEPLVDDHPAAAYVEKHGDGVGNIGLRVCDAAEAFAEAVRRGARPVSPPTERDGVVLATIMGFGDVTHTFVQRPVGTDERALPSLRPVDGATADPGGLLGVVDHFAVCVEPGQLENTAGFYREILDFEVIFTERIAVGTQAMTTTVVQSASGAVTLTLIEPEAAADPGHIDQFLKNHGGPGVQHIAFTAGDVVEAVELASRNGVEFLTTPDAYYTLLTDRMELARHSVEELRQLNILVDQDHGGQLYQIFARSVHPRNTFFLELIERVGASSFGSGNIAALYEAVESQRSQDEAA